MTGDLVPASHYLAQQRPVPPRHPAQREEGGLGLNRIEQIEDLAHVAVDPIGEAIPVVAVDHVLERADLEPVLDIDGQTVDDRSRGPPFRKRNRVHATLPRRVRRPWSDPSL